MALCSNLGPDDTVALGSSSGSDQDIPGDSTSLEHPHGPSWWPRPLESVPFSMVSVTTDLNTDLGCGRVMDLDNTMAPVEST